jgi:hypothetical protein
MTEKELRRLSRAQLLEMLLRETERNEALQKELDEANAQLADRKIKIERAGSIAQASLQLNGVFEACQRAADQYIESIRGLVAQAVPEETRAQEAQIWQQAESEAARHE